MPVFSLTWLVRIFSIYMVQKKFDASMLFILVPILLGAASYYFWNKQKAS